MLLPTLVGCSSESRRVCDHLRTLVEEGTVHDVRNKDYSLCVKEARAFLREDAEAFRQYTLCLLQAESLDEAAVCKS